jgi:exodeoxyribonuclease VII large subunit
MDEQRDSRTGEREVLSVGQLCALIKNTLENDFSRVLVSGEISNLREYDSGHIYFTIKESKASIAAVLFSGSRRTLPPRVKLKDGVRAIFTGRVSFYPDRGTCQIIVSAVELEEGEGDLFRRFEELKQKLYAEGLFAEGRKKPLPWYPRTVAVVTSTGGAVLHDILQTSIGRAPGIDIYVYPSTVQGEGAVAELVRAVTRADRDGLADVIIIARGGGSIEDLWPFNDEALARCIADCNTPVVSAVGHEPDFTICDFAADLRAPTPTAAALRVFPERAALADALESYARRIASVHGYRLARAGEHLRRLSVQSLRRGVMSKLERLAQRHDNQGAQIKSRITLLLREASGRLAALGERLEKHNPELPLRKGFALIRKGGTEERVRTAANLCPGDTLDIIFADGCAESQVRAVKLQGEKTE